MLEAANAAIQGVKEIADLVKKTNDIPLYEKIVALQGQVVQLASERLKLFSENQELKSKLELKAKIRFENPYYWEENNEVPLCPKCYGRSNGEIRIFLTHPPQDYAGGHGRNCRNCGEFFKEGPRRNLDPVHRPRSYWE